MGEYKTEMKKVKKKPAEEIIPVKREKPAYKQPFKPAALKKCEPFMPDQVQYSEEKERLKAFYALSKEVI